jgi:hypothetical protein
MTKRESDLLTHAQYARHRKAQRLPGGTREAVSNAVTEGRISTINGKIHPMIADAEWAKNTRARVSPHAAALPAPAAAPGDLVAQAAAAATPAAAADRPPAVDTGYTVFRAKREQADSEIAVMTAARMRGELVKRDDMARAVFEFAREMRDRLTSCASRVSAEVASLTTAEACQSVIEREHRIVLELVVSFCRQRSLGNPLEAAT